MLVRGPVSGQGPFRSNFPSCRVWWVKPKKISRKQFREFFTAHSLAPKPRRRHSAPKKVYINLEPSLVRSGLVARLDATERYEATLVQAEADCVEVNLQQQHLGTACSMVVGKLHVLKIAPEGAESSIAEYFFQFLYRRDEALR